jgi:hypothetical protein
VPSKKVASINDDEKFELILWLIERYDNLRASTSNRAAIVLSADTLLLAGSTFLLDKILSSGTFSNAILKVLLALGGGITVAFLVLSIYFSVNAVVSPWKTSRDLFGDIPNRFLFQQRDTVKAFKKFKDFENKFNNTSKHQIMDYALAELWTGINQHFYRYQTLRYHHI